MSRKADRDAAERGDNKRLGRSNRAVSYGRTGTLTSHPFEMKPREFRKRRPPSSVGSMLLTTMETTRNLKLLTEATVLTTAIVSPALAMGPPPRPEPVQNHQQPALPPPSTRFSP